MHRVLIVVSQGMASYVCDPDVEVVLFDQDIHTIEPELEPPVSAKFADLASLAGIPFIQGGLPDSLCKFGDSEKTDIC